MTIQELYVFACKNNLLEKDVYQVINKFNNFSKSQPSQAINDTDNTFHITKVEWSFEEVMELFSN